MDTIWGAYLHFFDEDDNDYADVGAEFDVTLVKQG